MTKDVEKAELLNTFFILFVTNKAGFQESQALETGEKTGARKTYPWWKRIRQRNT